MKGIALALTLSFLASCIPARKQTDSIALIDPSEGSSLIRPCSRRGPENADAFFLPKLSDVARLEHAAKETLSSYREEHSSLLAQSGVAESLSPIVWLEDDQAYQRQFVGYIKEERRMIYGSYHPLQPDRELGRSAVIVCDGGPSYFGVEYDISEGEVERITFNAGLSPPYFPDIELD